MKTRTISGAVLIAVLFGLFYCGGYVLLAALFLFSEIGLWEYAGAMQSEHKPYRNLSMAACAAYYAILAVRPEWIGNGAGGFLFLTAFFLLLMIVSVFCYPKRRYEDAFLSLGGVLYVAVLFSFLYFVRSRENGFYYTWFIFFAAWGSDTFAYLSGRAFGRHKLVPVLSPNKTVEGAAGGVLGAILLVMGYGLLIRSHLGLPLPTLLCLTAGIGLFGAVLGQVGDLFSSSIKRFTGIKDFGHLIPGHGGILDRFDSILLAGPIVVMVIRLLIP